MISIKSSAEIALELAQRLRARRLRRGWTQEEMAVRAGVRPATYVLFERTGRISLIRLLKVLEILELAQEFERIGRSDDLHGLTIDDVVKPERQRGRRKQG